MNKIFIFDNLSGGCYGLELASWNIQQKNVFLQNEFIGKPN